MESRLKAGWTLMGGLATLSRGWSSEMLRRFRRLFPEPENIVPTSGIRRPISDILSALNKKVPDSVIRTSVEDGKYILWYIVNRFMNMYAPEWLSGLSFTLYGLMLRYLGNQHAPLQHMIKAMGRMCKKLKQWHLAFDPACARLGLGLHLYHENVLSSHGKLYFWGF